MSADALIALARDAWSLIAGDAWTLGAFGVLLLSGAGAIVMLAASTRRRGARASAARIPARHESRARGRTPRAARVIDMARHGEAPESIARRTGLALDAVATILRTTGDVLVSDTSRPVRDAVPAAATRHASPRMATFAAPPIAR